MKQTLPPHRSTARAGFAVALAVVASLATCPLASAKGKPGGGGGGGNDSGGDGPPPKVSAPVSYEVSELRWIGDTEPDYGGTYLASVNSQGLAVGCVLPASGSFAVINLGPNGESSNTVIDLNSVFSASVAAVNTQLAPLYPDASDWKIAYGAGINEAGQIACILRPYVWSNTVDPKPQLFGVASLELRGAANALTVLDTAPMNGWSLEPLTEHGDVLTSRKTALPGAPSGTVFFEHRLYENLAASGTLPASGTIVPQYQRIDLGVVSKWQPAQVNSSLQLSWRGYNADFVDQVNRFDLRDSGAEILTLWEGTWNTTIRFTGIAENGATYGTINSAKGKNGSMFAHRFTPGAVDLLSSEEAETWYLTYCSPSKAQTSGEEEVLMWMRDTGEYQLYKPNFGGRFPLPDITPDSLYLASISPPVNGSATSSSHADATVTYSAGHIVYVSDRFFYDPAGDYPYKSYILRPQP